MNAEGHAPVATGFSRIPPYSSCWQQIVLLLHTMCELNSAQWKYDVAEFIENKEKYDFKPCDFRLGRWSNAISDFEPVWLSELDRVSRLCESFGLMYDSAGTERWHITPAGKTIVMRMERCALNRVLDVRRCYLWSWKFKELMDPRYIPGKGDWQRPHAFYDLIESLYPRQRESKSLAMLATA